MNNTIVKRMLGVLVMLIVVFESVEATAGTYTLKSSGRTDQKWGTSGNWQEGGGAPVSTSDVAVYPYDEPRTSVVTSIDMRWVKSDSSVDFGIDSLRKTPLGSVIRMNTKDTHVGLRETVDCWGCWYNANMWSSFKTLPNDGQPLVLRNVYGSQGIAFNAVNAGDVMQVENLYSQPTFNKNGPGELVLATPVGISSSVNLNEGTLTIGGATFDETAGYAPNPSGHWDAAQIPDADVGEPDERGRRTLAKWAAASDGNGLDAVPSTMSGQPAPFLGARSVRIPGRETPVPLVDFGAASGSDQTAVATYGAPATLSVGYSAIAGSTKDPSKNVREVFYVAEATNPMHSRSFLGRDGNFHYAAAAQQSSLFVGPSSAKGFDPQYVTGCLDGVPYGGNELKPYCREPAKLAVYSASTPSNRTDCGIYYLCGTWGNGSMGGQARGGWRAAELLTYNRTLTEAERRATIHYLKNKWMSASAEAVTRDVGSVLINAANTAVKVASGHRAYVNNVVATQPLVKKGAGELVLDRVTPSTATIQVQEGSVRFARTGAASVKTVPDDGLWFHGDAQNADSFTYDTDGKSVLSWNDTRGSGHTVAFTNYVGKTAPVRQLSSKTGLVCVDCGEATNSVSFSPLACNVNPGNHLLEIFFVWRKKVTTDDGNEKRRPAPMMINGYCRSNNAYIFQDGKMNNDAALATAGDVRLDGVPRKYDSFQGTAMADSGVFSLQPRQKVNVTHLATANNKSTMGGASELYEVLLYTRRLSEQERRNVEAYLLDKWHNHAPHPLDSTAVGTVSFEGSAAPVLDVADGTTLSVAAVSGSGTLVKKGAGTVSVASVGAGVTGLSLQGGTMAVSGDYTAPGELAVTLDAAGNVGGRLSVGGVLTMPASGTLRLGYTGEVNAPVGTYEIASAAGGVAGTPSWTVVCDNPKFRRHARLAVRDGKILLEINPYGMLLLVR